MALGSLPVESKPERPEILMKRKLVMYRSRHADVKVREACDAIISFIDQNEMRRMTSRELMIDSRSWQMAIAARMNGDQRSALEIVQEIKNLLQKDLIF